MLRPLLGIARWNTAAGRCRQVAGGAGRRASWPSCCRRIRRKPVRHDLPPLVDRLPGAELPGRNVAQFVSAPPGVREKHTQNATYQSVSSGSPFRARSSTAAIAPVREHPRLGRGSLGRRRFAKDPTAARRPRDDLHRLLRIANRGRQVPLFVVGSSTSRSQSPMMLMDSVVKNIAHPGTPAIHHAFRR